MKKKKLKARIKELENSQVINNLSNSTITVNADDSEEGVQQLADLTRALLNVSAIVLARKNTPVYGVYMGSKGIE